MGPSIEREGAGAASQRLLADTIKALALVLDFDEGRKLYHGWRVAVLAHELGRAAALDAGDHLFVAGLLHDIGGVGLRDHVVHRLGREPLDDETSHHGATGAHILAPLRLLQPIVPLVEHHHERFDGSGFPRGLYGPAIPPGATLLGLADGLEVAMRRAAPEERHAVAMDFTLRASGRLVPAEVGAAALGLLRRAPELVVTLYDEALLARRVAALEPHLPHSGAVDRLELFSQLLWVFARVVDAKHAFTMGHSTRAAYYAYKIAQAIGSDDSNLWDVVWAALLHDVGNVGVPRAVLEKEPALDAADEVIIRRHAEDTHDIIATIADLAYLAEPASAHHERYDGGGYPRGTRGEAIPLIARILAFADVYDALTHDRPHRGGVGHAEALDLMRAEVGTRFDPHLADAAFGALERHGVSNPRDEERERFERFFVAESPDVTRLFAHPARAAPHSVRAFGRGLIMPPAEPWTDVRLGPHGALGAGAEALGALLGTPPPAHVRDFLDAPSQAILERLGEAARPGELVTEYLFTALGLPLEAAVARDEHGLALHLRPAEGRVQSMKRTTLFYRNFLASSEGVLFTDAAGVIIDANHRLCAMFGYELGELIGRTPAVLSSGRQDAVFYRELWSRITAPGVGSWRGELVDRRKDGAELDVLLTIDSVRDSSGSCVGFIGRVVDRSEDKRLERRVAEMAAFAEHAPAPLLRLDAALAIELANESMRGLFGHAPLIGTAWPALCPELDGDAYRRALATEGGYQHEARLGGSDFLLTYRQVEGGAVYVYGADITVRKRAETELVRRDRDLVDKNRELTRLNRLKSDLVAVTSHDLKSPLSSIIMLASRLKERQPELDAAKVTSELDRILESGHRLVSFINDLLDMDKLESGRVELVLRRVHVPAILRFCIDALSPSQPRGQRFVLRVAGPVRAVRGDAARIEQVVGNLLANAAKFSPDGGDIEVGCADIGPAGVELTVSDRGPGIPEEDLGAVFDRYYQVARQGRVPKRGFGVGLGLAIVRALCEAHGGSVCAEVRPGGGATFRVRLPAHERRPDVRGAAVILDPFGRHAPGLQDALRTRGFTATCVENAYDARRICAFEEPELVFVCDTASGLDALVESARAATGGRVLVVNIVDGDGEPGSGDGLFDEVLVAPLLDVEVLELVRTAELRQERQRGAR